ncbi:hypothetical protein P154DRAFT_568579 [Amniculicola lignicola CBS 123094]|uniref:Uncharacterized protein n=1 Tax=Amniculicola lignicola CBS 123094 TaxID=1392246 RepID=A0A6A5X4E4_9PLEO|nr:hypothetical protein P154DRAFT_568579 [Amniculicola lignicola CBS 123094]
MSGFEVAGLVLASMGIVPVFKKGYDMIQQYRKRRRSRGLGSKDSNTSKLEVETYTGQTTVANKYNDYYKAYGRAFAVGDDRARNELKDIIIQLQHGLIIALQTTLNNNTLTNPAQLVTLTISGRLDTFAALSELAQRVAVAAPISTTFATASLGNTNDWTTASNVASLGNTNDWTSAFNIKRNTVSECQPPALLLPMASTTTNPYGSNILNLSAFNGMSLGRQARDSLFPNAAITSNLENINIPSISVSKWKPPEYQWQEMTPADRSRTAKQMIEDSPFSKLTGAEKKEWIELIRSMPKPDPKACGWMSKYV